MKLSPASPICGVYGGAMGDRTELLEAALDSLPEGFALVGQNGSVAFWNRAAAAITGYSSADLLGRPAGDALRALVAGGERRWPLEDGAETAPNRGSLVRLRHRLGHELPAMVRALVLRDGLGARIGMAALFHPAERLDALPHGESSGNAVLAASQAEIQDRLETEFEDFARGNVPLGVLWVTVDQAHELRRTHGRSACEAMLEKVVHVLGAGLRPGEEIGRWGDDEFLVISHERTAEMLNAHARQLAGMARTADFRWWGDRVSLTVSIGAAQAAEGDTLSELLERAQTAMRASVRTGGNSVTHAAGGHTCSPS
jgi:diguanylate cyclase (GGDEF)-like protein/PAS domain S-box-containing protein